MFLILDFDAEIKPRTLILKCFSSCNRTRSLNKFRNFRRFFLHHLETVCQHLLLQIFGLVSRNRGV